METKNSRSRNIVVADSSGLISMVIPSDANHLRATQGARQISTEESTIFIPAEVLAETINILGKKYGHAQATTTGRRLTGDNAFIVVETNELIRSRALDLMDDAAGSVSYTDCIVVAAAEHYNCAQIYGFDRFFHQRGFAFPGTQEEAA
jgi:predicted nucleic acid-binding protein